MNDYEIFTRLVRGFPYFATMRAVNDPKGIVTSNSETEEYER